MVERLQANNQRWIGVWFGIGVCVEVSVVRRARRRRKLTNSLTTLAVEHQRPVRMMRGECFAAGFVRVSCFVGDRVELVWRRFSPWLDRDLFRSLPNARSSVSRSLMPCIRLVGNWSMDNKLTINGGLVLGSESGLAPRHVSVAEA